MVSNSYNKNRGLAVECQQQNGDLSFTLQVNDSPLDGGGGGLRPVLHSQFA